MSTSTACLPITTQTTAPPSPPAWKSELHAKLEAHRQRRTAFADAPQVPARRESVPASPAARATAARVAARVAERYAKAPSYSEVLAASAAAASRAAETAAFAAQEANDAARALLSNLAERDHALSEEEYAASRQRLPGVTAHAPAAELADAGLQEQAANARSSADNALSFDTSLSFGATVEHHEPLPPRGELPPRPAYQGGYIGIVDALAEATVSPAMNLPAKLIEFPRELIAARRSRPRLAEGPLLEELDPLPEPSSLRIFEVTSPGRQAMDPAAQAEARSALFVNPPIGGSAENELDSPSAATPEQHRYLGRRGGQEQEQACAPEWQSIRLGAHPDARTYEQPLRSRQQEHAVPATLVLYPATLGDRTMAALVDLAVVGAAFLVFVLVFASCTAHPPLDKTALACAGVALAALAIFYQWLFLSYGCATPGMHYAQVALCTFEDGNPTRQALRSRVWAGLLTALPLGLGLLWAVFDEDSLGWHDRMSRTYQRSYR